MEKLIFALENLFEISKDTIYVKLTTDEKILWLADKTKHFHIEYLKKMKKLDKFTQQEKMTESIRQNLKSRRSSVSNLKRNDSFIMGLSQNEIKFDNISISAKHKKKMSISLISDTSSKKSFSQKRKNRNMKQSVNTLTKSRK